MKMNPVKKIVRNLPTGMQEELDNMDEKQLKERIGKSATIVSETKNQQKEDPEIAQAREVLKNLQEPYKETLKAQDAVIKYCVLRLKEKGKL